MCNPSPKIKWKIFNTLMLLSVFFWSPPLYNLLDLLLFNVSCFPHLNNGSVLYYIDIKKIIMKQNFDQISIQYTKLVGKKLAVQPFLFSCAARCVPSYNYSKLRDAKRNEEKCFHKYQAFQIGGKECHNTDKGNVSKSSFFSVFEIENYTSYCLIFTLNTIFK